MSMKEAKWILPCIKPSPLSTPEQTMSYLTKIRIGTFQVVFVIIVFTIAISFLLAFDIDGFSIGDSSTDSLWFWLSAIRSISSGLALFYLVNYSFFAARIPELYDLQLKAKFNLVQLSMVFTELQPIIISFCADQGWIANTDDYSKEEITSWTNNLLLCSEMIIVGFLQILIFPVKDYDTPPSSRRCFSQRESLNCRPIK
ncbi:unnamed protein product [Blepharisma stoltei]|uniref:Uncharacterized protein n=1 Tax=Blepharisma stoltei TaxID=1481888 RepID=A0AAU9JCB2_9CILI|nr:unnamed protein product [Blepharisma stoltei]